jgi:hypothetical protein
MDPNDPRVRIAWAVLVSLVVLTGAALWATRVL